MAENRDDFDRATKIKLATRAGHVCSLPQCRAKTSGPGDPGEVSNIGIAAHICAAAVGGPRFDPAQSSAQRKSLDNGIWVCANHGKVIDDAESTYTVETLQEYKKIAEVRAGEEIGKASLAIRDIETVAVIAVDRYLERLRDLREGFGRRGKQSIEDFDRQVKDALVEHSYLLMSGAATVDDLLNDPEFQRIADNYALEAEREALRERGKMLAYALAGTLCEKTLTISQKSRAERVIRELDPEDALVLHRISRVHIDQAENDDFDRTGMARMSILEQNATSKDVLHAAGCITWENNGGFDGGVFYAYITTIGHNVVKILEGYTKSRAALPSSTSSEGA